MTEEDLSKLSQVIIVGAGVFGLSTAIALGKRYPRSKVLVIDRFEPPVIDGTSVDTTRCIQVDYNDELHYELAAECLCRIKEDPELSKVFHQNGMSFIYDGKPGVWDDVYNHGKASAMKLNLGDLNGLMVDRDTNLKVYQGIHGKNSIPPSVDDLKRETWWNKGYTNLSDGFIEADAAIKILYERAKSFENVDFLFKPVDKLSFTSGETSADGVIFSDGSKLSSDLIVVATGAWTSKIVDISEVSKISAIEVAWYAVTDEEQEHWKNMSITTNLSTGINLFPPLKNEIKILRRSSGFKNTVSLPNPSPGSNEDELVEVCYPRTIVDHPNDWIPEDAEIALRENMKEIMPPLASRPFIRTKLCWVTQTTTSNFLIDRHPTIGNLIMATGGSAHAWKFVPILGDKVVDLITGQLEPRLASIWSWKEKVNVTDDDGNGYRMKGEMAELKDVIRSTPF